MSFLNDVIFPENISKGSIGGPEYSTRITEVASGFETRNINWVLTRHTYNVAYGIKLISDIEDVLSIFHVANGMAHSFRYKDFLDYKSCNVESIITLTDQQIGVGDAIEDAFQLIKTYTNGSFSKVRDITKPKDGTVLIALDSILQVTGYTIDYTTGIVTFTTPPGASVVITAGFEYHVPVRFQVDYIPVTLEVYNVGGTNIPLVEVKGE